MIASFEKVSNHFRTRQRAVPDLVATACMLFLFAWPAGAQSNQVGAFYGGVLSQNYGFQGPAGGQAHVSAGYAAGLNLDHGFTSNRWIVPHIELEFTVLPPRNVKSTSAAVPQSYDSLYLTPGLRLEFLPRALAHPWVAAGGGYTLYIQSQVLTNGQTYSVHFVSRAVGDFGGGMDVRVWRSKQYAWAINLRGQFRDFVSGNPELNAPLSASVQHNIVASAGVFLEHQSAYRRP